jgi:hypothetical protein
MASASFGLIEGSFDPEYQRVKQRFQTAFSVKSYDLVWPHRQRTSGRMVQHTAAML